MTVSDSQRHDAVSVQDNAGDPEQVPGDAGHV